jgi:hypothetical protein
VSSIGTGGYRAHQHMFSISIRGVRKSPANGSRQPSISATLVQL